MRLSPKVGDLLAWHAEGRERIGEVTDRLTDRTWRVRVIARQPGEAPARQLHRDDVTGWWRRRRV